MVYTLPDGKIISYQHHLYIDNTTYLISNMNITNKHGYILVQNTQIPTTQNMTITLPTPLDTYNTFTIEMSIKAKSGYRYNSCGFYINDDIIWSNIDVRDTYTVHNVIRSYHLYDNVYSGFSTGINNNYINVRGSGGYNNYGIEFCIITISVQ